MYDLQTIKNRINCVDYARSIGLNISKSGDRCVSPLRSGAKNKTSFVVNDDFFTDFGSGMSGDVIDFCAMHEFNGNRGQAIQHLAKRVGLTDDKFDEGEWKKYTEDLNAKINRWHQNLTKADIEYLHKRRVSDELIERYKIGRTDDGRLSLPYFKNGYCCYYATRHMPGGAMPDSKYMKMKIDDYNQHIIFGLDTITDKKDLIVIAEGMFDCLAFIDEGYTCVSAITGRFSAVQEKTLFPLLKQYKQVFIVYDNDAESKAGEKFTVTMTKKLAAHRIPFIVGTVPAGYKDISEYYEACGKLQQIIADAEPGLNKMCSVLNTREEFEAFARNECRFMTKTDVSLLFEQAAKLHENFGAKWLKVLEKECTSAPTDTYIVDEILSKKKLLYHDSFGFYEYNGKFWEYRTRGKIRRYINDALGVYKSGSRVGSVLTVLEGEAWSASLENLNQLEAINFCNGTLELHPELKFREHSPDDMFSYCLGYSYQPGAKSKAWEDYVWSVTENTDKVSLLQEWMGYPMFTDCSMQKALVLLGKGENGKSPYVNMFKFLYGESNVSNVAMSALARQFQAIRLRGALVNTCTETASDVTGAESAFKQVTCGEVISDCFKGKDVIDFAPRAKWILSANKFSTSKTDDSDGYARRFCFCNFNLKFKKPGEFDPRNPLHRRADPDIEKKLTNPDELPGIFNWALEGYQRLKKNKCFTQPEDQKGTMEEFKELNNPLIVFIKEFEFDRGETSISNEDFYRSYCDWADNCNHHKLSRNSFLTRVAGLVEEYRADYMEQKRTKSWRGYRMVTLDIGELEPF